MENLIPFDGTDPVVVVLTWFLTMLLGKLITRFTLDQYRAALPFAAVVLATGIRVGIDAVMGDPLTWATLARALAAGGVAVLSHSQLREVMKALPSPVDSADDNEVAPDQQE